MTITGRLAHAGTELEHLGSSQASQKGPLSDPKKLLDDLVEFDKVAAQFPDVEATKEMAHAAHRTTSPSL